jgi:hypothetical protein
VRARGGGAQRHRAVTGKCTPELRQVNEYLGVATRSSRLRATPASTVQRALSTTQERYAFAVFERAFQEYGLPDALRTDNGVPFASAHALYGLSKLAVWWLRLGIRLQRIAPGHPEQNGRHERMHLTLKQDATRPAAANVLQQQMRFDTFVRRYNHDRPHQALAMATPASRYTASARPYAGWTTWPIPSTTGPPWSPTVAASVISAARSISVRSLRGRPSASSRPPTVSGSCRLWTTTWDTSTIRRVDSSRLPTPSARDCYPCLRNGPEKIGSSGWIRTSNPPVSRLLQVGYHGGSSWV